MGALDRMNPDLPLYSPEGMLTAALLDRPEVYPEVRWVDPDIFEWQAVRSVYVAATWVLDKHPNATSEELLTRTRQVLIEYEKKDALDLLIRMIGTPVALGVQAGKHARDLWEKWQRSNLASAALRMNQIVNSTLALDEQVEMLEQTWVDALALSHAEPGWKPIDGLSTVSGFMAASDETHEWVIPGLLERQERLMLVAPEKAGKSVFTRQVALLLASGRHPLNPGCSVPPMTTLMVDLENPAPVARRDFRRQIAQMDNLFGDDEIERAYLWHKPSGIHLGDRPDRLLLHQVIDRVQPDLLCISPIYKAYDGLEQSWEQQAHGVQKPLDRLREEFNLALWLEHHAPWGEKGMREIRAIGSSRWARWLDYQVSLVPKGRPPYHSLGWQSVRRDERKMAPERLVRGKAGEPSWVPEWSDGSYGFDLAMQESEL